MLRVRVPPWTPLEEHRMSDYIIGTEPFTKHLDAWLLKSKQEDANFLYTNRAKIPPVFRKYNKTLYRGMIMDQKTLDKIESGGSILLDKHTSWSKDVKVAMKFIKDSSYKIQGQEGIPVILTKVINPSEQIIDIDSFVLFMGESQLIMIGYDEINLDSAQKEKEVLIAKGVRITRDNVEKIT